MSAGGVLWSVLYASYNFVVTMFQAGGHILQSVLELAHELAHLILVMINIGERVGLFLLSALRVTALAAHAVVLWLHNAASVVAGLLYQGCASVFSLAWWTASVTGTALIQAGTSFIKMCGINFESILDLAAQLPFSLWKAALAASAATWSVIVTLWRATVIQFFVAFGKYMYFVGTSLASLLSAVYYLVTSPFSVDGIVTSYVISAGQDIKAFLTTGGFRYVVLYLVSGICVYILVRWISTYLQSRGLTFPIYHTPGNFINNHHHNFEAQEFSDEDEYMYERDEGATQLTALPLVENAYIYETSDEENGDNAADGETDAEAEGDNSDDMNNTSDEETGDEADDSDDEESEADRDSDATDVTAVSEQSEQPIEVDLPESSGHYGLRARASPFPAAGTSVSQIEKMLESERDKRKCVVCQDFDKSVLLLPCRHMCLCIDCARHLVSMQARNRRVCPLCRGRITTIMNVYL